MPDPCLEIVTEGGDRGTPSGHGDLALLLSRAAAGDQAAFASLYDATASRANLMALRVVGDAAQAEEITQDAFLHIWQHAARFDAERGNAMSWILMVVRGQALSRLRSDIARSTRERTFHREVDPLDKGRGDTTHEGAVTAVESEILRTALDQLAAPQRQVLELAFLSGHTYAEVALLTGLPLGTVKSRIRAGLQRLRASF